jgi:hypothetical protein
VWKSVFESPQARNDSIIQARLYHLHMVHWAFLHVWLDQPMPEIPVQSKFTDIAALVAWGHEAHESTGQYVNQIDEAARKKSSRPPGEMISRSFLASLLRQPI